MRDIDADADETVWYQSLNVIIDLVVAKATKAKSSCIYARPRLSSRNNRKLCAAFGFSRIAFFEQRKSKHVLCNLPQRRHIASDNLEFSPTIRRKKVISCSKNIFGLEMSISILCLFKFDLGKNSSGNRLSLLRLRLDLVI